MSLEKMRNPKNWNRGLEKHLPRNRPLVGAEIGVFEGDHAHELLETFPNILMLYLIDPFCAYPGYPEGDMDPNIDFSEAGFREIEKDMNDRLRPYTGRWKHFKQMSTSVDLSDLDFVYVDGNHKLPFCREDIEYWFPRVKKGGIFCGHDLHLPGVRSSVEDLALRENLRVVVEIQDWIIYK